jgi:hypothetical protein
MISPTLVRCNTRRAIVITIVRKINRIDDPEICILKHYHGMGFDCEGELKGDARQWVSTSADPI